jgi:hypothetical protein
MKSYKLRGTILIAIAMIITALAVSCKTPQRRHDRLVHKYGEELCYKDTVWIKDTIVKNIKVPVPEYKDSFVFKRDTMYETKRIVTYKKGDTVWVRVKSDTIEYTDTLYLSTPSPVIFKKSETKPKHYLEYLVFFLLGALIMAYIKK